MHIAAGDTRVLQAAHTLFYRAMSLSLSTQRSRLCVPGTIQKSKTDSGLSTVYTSYSLSECTFVKVRDCLKWLRDNKHAEMERFSNTFSADRIVHM